MKLRFLNREFRATLRGLFLYVLLMVLLSGLGFWQLHRAEEKKVLLQQHVAMIDAPTLNLNKQWIDNPEYVRYRKIHVSGHYDEAHQFLLDNQMLNGRPGYFVLTPFLIDGQARAVLVNRGWVVLNADRTSLPNVSLKTGVMEIDGRINNFPSVGIRLKGAEIPTAGWPAVVQTIDTKLLSVKLSYNLYDFQIELDTNAPEGYRREWKIAASILPERHLAYAVQWFGLALALTGLFIWISIRKKT